MTKIELEPMDWGAAHMLCIALETAIEAMAANECDHDQMQEIANLLISARVAENAAYKLRKEAERAKLERSK